MGFEAKDNNGSRTHAKKIGRNPVARKVLIIMASESLKSVQPIYQHCCCAL
jgi:hypothetical protein